MDQALGLLTLLGRGPGIAVLPGAARRAFATINQIHQPSQLYGPFCLCFLLRRFPYLDLEKNHGSVNASTEANTTRHSARHPKALSTSFEKTCMRQIHCPDRLIAMVNKGPYHAQGLFNLKRTHSRTRASLCFCYVRICSCLELASSKLCANRRNLVHFCPVFAKSFLK